MSKRLPFLLLLSRPGTAAIAPSLNLSRLKLAAGVSSRRGSVACCSCHKLPACPPAKLGAVHPPSHLVGAEGLGHPLKIPVQCHGPGTKAAPSNTHSEPLFASATASEPANSGWLPQLLWLGSRREQRQRVGWAIRSVTAISLVRALAVGAQQIGKDMTSARIK